MKRSIRKSILCRSKAACLAVVLAGAVLISPFGAMSIKAASPLDDANSGLEIRRSLMVTAMTFSETAPQAMIRTP